MERMYVFAVFSIDSTLRWCRMLCKSLKMILFYVERTPFACTVIEGGNYCMVSARRPMRFVMGDYTHGT